MDVLSDVLKLIRLEGAVYFQSDFSAPWGMQMDSSHLVQFHIVVRGQCWIWGEGIPKAIPLVGGDIIAFPTGDAHVLADQPRRQPVPGIRVLEGYQNDQPLFQGPDISTTLVCGHFEFNRDVDHPLLQDLPRFIHVRGTDRHRLAWLESATQLIVSETKANYPGKTAVIDRLAEVLFIQMLRAYMIEREGEGGYISALNDPLIYTALQQIHARPAAGWTIETIAQSVGLSRAAFALRFKELVGEPPMTYLTNWRMQLARQLLMETDQSLFEISNRVGYSSDAAFTRAFKRRFNLNPGAMRRARQESSRVA